MAGQSELLADYKGVAVGSTGIAGPQSVRTASPLRHALPGLPAFFWQPYAVYIPPGGRANSHTVFCTPQRPREGGR